MGSFLPNLYPVFEEREEVGCYNGRFKTVAFWIAFSIGFIVIFFLNLRAKPTITVERDPAKLDQYRLDAAFQPICPCTRFGIPFKNFTTVTAPTDGICEALKQAAKFPMPIMYHFPVQMGVSLCEQSRTLMDQQVKAFGKQFVISSMLLNEETLKQTTIAVFDTAVDNGLFTIFTVNLYGNRIGQLERPLYWSAMEIHNLGGNILAKDTRNCNSGYNPAGFWNDTIGGSCSTFQALGNWKLADFTDAAFWQTNILGNQTQAMSIVNALTANATSSYLNGSSEYFNLTFDTLRVPSILGFIDRDHYTNTTNFTAYFEACKPSKCTHYEERDRSIVEFITVTFALLGGLQTTINTVLQQVIPRILKYVCCGLCLPKKNNENTAAGLQMTGSA